jgi:spoIIIJ-associated protein
MASGDDIKRVTEELLNLLGANAQVVVTEDEGRTRVSVEAPEHAGILIGKGGENLRALQHVLLLLVSKKIGAHFEPGNFVLDVNEYQRERENYLVALAKNTAYEVKEMKAPKELEPMPASERRVIHVTLASDDGVVTESVGERGSRKVVVKPRV